MNDQIKADICVIGAGAGGLSVAAGASQMGAKVVLVEKAKMGGDCLNYGCVPSKALLAAAHRAQQVRTAPNFGIKARVENIDAQKVFDHVHGTIAAIAPHDSVERFEGMGVEVIQGAARFVGPQEIEAAGKRIHAKRFVIATGSRAFIPPIAGLEDVDFYTNETIFNLHESPRHLIILGGGPIGMEMAQAYRQLGSKVSVLVRSQILPKDDPELVDCLRRRFENDEIDLVENCNIIGINQMNGEIIVKTDQDLYTGSHLLVATGRQVNADGLDLEAANIAYDTHGIRVDARLRTTNKKVFAIGDVTGGLQFTHKAGYDAGIIIRNALFRLPAKADYSALPWVTYCAPELASVGLSEQQAREKGDEIRILRWPYSENDRARAEGKTDGLIKVITNKKGLILGASIVGEQAGELIQVWTLAISQKMKIGAIASMISPYPTLGEISKRAAGSFYTPSLFSEKTKKIVRFLLGFG